MLRNPARTLGLVSALALALAPGLSTGAAPPSAADLVDYRSADDVRLSPDGRAAIFTVSAFADDAGPRSETHTRLYRVDVDDDGGARALTPREHDAREPTWSPDGEAIAVVMQRGNEDTGIYRLPAAGGRAERLTPDDSALSPASLAWAPSGDHLAFLAPDPKAAAQWRERDPQLAGSEPPNDLLWIMPATGGQPEAITPSTWSVEGLTWSPSGERLAVIAQGLRDGRTRSLVTVARDGSGHRALSHTASWLGTRNHILDWSPDGERIAFTQTGSQLYGHWIGVVPAGGGAVRQRLRDYDGHLMRAVWASGGHTLIAQAFSGLQSELLRIPGEGGDPRTLTRFNARYPDFDVADERIVYLGESTDAPANVWRYRPGGADGRLTDLNPDLRDHRFGAVRRVQWVNSEDGVRLEGLLVTPPNGIAEPPYPTVVQLHGGPHFHWGKGFLGNYYDWAQWLAPRGYAVFLPNPRGSSGRGRAFARAIANRLGGPDGRDVMSGVDALVERGVADAEHLYLGGGSYGGYLTAWLLTRTDRFRAAVVSAGVSDFVSFAGTGGIADYWSRAFFPGGVQTRMAAYRDRSPLTYLHRVETPTLILHGADDGKIPVGQGRQLYHGLQELGVESELAVYPREGHLFGERGHRIDALSRVGAWFQRH